MKLYKYKHIKIINAITILIQIDFMFLHLFFRQTKFEDFGIIILQNDVIYDMMT